MLPRKYSAGASTKCVARKAMNVANPILAIPNMANAVADELPESLTVRIAAFGKAAPAATACKTPIHSGNDGARRK